MIELAPKLLQSPMNYRFLATPGVEVTNLAFAKVDVVWLPWKLSAEECVPNLRHTNEAICTYVTAGARIHLCSLSTGCKRTRSIATLIRLYLFSRVPNRGQSQMGTTRGKCNLKKETPNTLTNFRQGV